MPGHKVRTGCRTCKARRVKCDQTKPACLRCVKGRFLCEGYGVVLPVHTRNQLDDSGMTDTAAGLLPVNDGLILQRLDSSTGLGEADYSTWDFCRRYTTNELTSSSHSRFWTTTILASAQKEPVILQGLLALAVAHRARRQSKQPALSLTQYHGPELRIALKHYYSSIAHLREHLRRPGGCDKITVLIACLVLVYFDLVMGRYGESYLHLKNGRQILIQTTQVPGTGAKKPTLRLARNHTDPLSELSSEFAALDLQSVNFGSWETLFLLTDDDESRDGFRIPAAFLSIEDAWQSLTIIHNMLHHIVEVDAAPGRTSFTRKPWDVEATQRQSKVIVLLRKWRVAFDSSALRPTSAKSDSKSKTRQRFQRCQLLFLYLQFVAGNAHHIAQETEYDSLLPQFIAIVDLCEELAPSLPKVSIETAIIQPLFLVGCCCRHPVVRRRCMQILSVARVEGHWDASLIKLVTEVKMQAEEEEAGYVHDAAKTPAPLDGAWLTQMIPGHARYTDTLMFFVAADYHLLEIQLRRDRQPSVPSQGKQLGDFEIRKQVITWPPSTTIP